MAYSKKYTIDSGSGGDTVKVAIATKLDGDVDQLVTDLNTHEALATGIHGVTGTVLGTEDIDTDEDLTANSDTKLPSQQAVKAYVDAVKAYVDAVDADMGYTIQTFCELAAPADGTTYYLGNTYGQQWSTDAQKGYVYIPKAGTITRIHCHFLVAGTQAGFEDGTLNFRLNNSADTLISAAARVPLPNNQYYKYDASIAVVAGDVFEFKFLTPTWAVNPTNVRFSAAVFIKT